MMQFHESLAPLMIDIDAIQPHEDNYNNGDLEEIRTSIMVSGMYRPVYVQKSSGRIVAGNHTWMACKELEATQIPVVVLDIDDTTAKRLMVADNEIALKARPDTALLVKILTELNDTDSLMGTGVTQAELAQLVALDQIPFEDESEHQSWPSLCFQVPPKVKEGFLAMTDRAGGDRERFELMMRLAGWDG